MSVILRLLVVFVVLGGCEAALSFDCHVAPATPEDRRSDPEKLRVAHWNVEWLFLEKWDKHWTSPAEAMVHLETIAATIKQMDADVVNLAEVEDCNVLRTLIAKVGDDTYKPYLVRGTDTATGQNVGMITRVDPVTNLKRSTNRADFPVAGNKCGCASCGTGSSGVSKHYIATIRPNIFGDIHMIGAHLLAFPDAPDRCVQREAQAKVLQGLVQDLFHLYGPKTQFIAAGDYNDWDGQVLDIADSQPISRSLDFLKDVIQTEGYEGNELQNVAANVNQTSRYTAYYNPNGGTCKSAPTSSTSIDHILISNSLQQEHSITRFDTSLFGPPCATTKPYSDHWPIVVGFDRKAEPTPLAAVASTPAAAVTK